MPVTTFDPSEDRSDEQKAAEAAALEQGEKIAQMQEEDRARRFAENEAANDEPDLIAGKFKSQDDLLKAYEELQKKLGSEAPAEEPSEEVEPAEERVEEEVEEQPEATEITETVNYMHQLSKEVGDDGVLSEEAIDKLSSMDTKDLIKAYMSTTARPSRLPAGSELQAIRTPWVVICQYRHGDLGSPEPVRI